MAKKAANQLPDDWQKNIDAYLNDDDKFDELLFANLKPISPPEDFSTRVMAAIAADSQAAPTPTPTKVINFMRWRWAAGMGICAAAMALFVGVSSMGIYDEPAAMLTAKSLQIAEVTPILVTPTEKSPSAEISQTAEINSFEPKQESNQTPSQDSGDVPAALTQKTDDSTANTSEETDAPLPIQSDSLTLPRVAYGTEITGTMSARLLAAVDGNRIFQPIFAGNAAVFNTADETNIYSWRVDLTNPSEPHMSAVTAQSDLADLGEMLHSTADYVEGTTVVSSADKTMLAQNSSEGLWISLLEGDVFKLSENGGGKLLAWSADSSKLVFTDTNGALYVAYPLEQQVYQLADGGVKDVCWHSNNKTLLFTCESSNNDSLYIVETY